MSHLVLVGTVHRDPEGYHKLLSLLHEEGPDSLTLEMSPFAVRFRRRKGAAFKSRVSHILRELRSERSRLGPQRPFFSHPAIRHVFAIVEFPFEYLAASAFSRSRGVPFFCIDRSDYARERVSRIERELITRKNLEKLIRLSPSEVNRGIEREYNLASLATRRGLTTACSQSCRQEMLARDRFMASKVRELLDGSRRHRLVHVGGWEHLIPHGNGETLFTLLSDLHPARRLLPR